MRFSWWTAVVAAAAVSGWAFLIVSVRATAEANQARNERLEQCTVQLARCVCPR